MTEGYNPAPKELPGNHPSRDTYRHPLIEMGTILDVNGEDFTVVAEGLQGGRRYVDIPFMQPYAHHANGEGIYFLPEVGAACWICIPSDSRPFVLGFGAAYDADGSYSNLKRSLNPGDIYLGTRDDNFVVLRRGGTVQVGAGSIPQRMYIPVGNWIRDYCESYRLDTIGGDLVWEVQRSVMDTDGKQHVLLSLRTKDKASDEGHAAALLMGHVEDGDTSDTAVKLTVYQGPEATSSEAVSLTIKKSGDVEWVLDGDFKVTSKGGIELVSSESDVVFKSDKGFAVVDGKTAATVKSATKVVMEAPQVLLGSPQASLAVALGPKVETELNAIKAALDAIALAAGTTNPYVSVGNVKASKTKAE